MKKQLRLRTGVSQYSSVFYVSEFNKYSANNMVATTTSPINVAAGDTIYVFGASNQTAVPNGTYAIANVFSSTRFTFSTSNSTYTGDTTGVRIYKKATVQNGDIRNDGTSIILPKNSFASLGSNNLFKDNLAAPNNVTYNSSAILELSSDTKGFLPVRMTQAQRLAISSPAIGLHVYQTDGVEGMYVNKSTGWVFVY